MNFFLFFITCKKGETTQTTPLTIRMSPRACVREGARWCQLVEGRRRHRPEAVILAHVELSV